jgi:serine/threonine protein phosphatase PrpC
MSIFKNLTSCFRVSQAPAKANIVSQPTILFDLEAVASAVTDPGLARSENEDSVSFTRPPDPRLSVTHGALAIVADGMGGCSGGEIASQCACRSIEQAYFENNPPPRSALLMAIEMANRQIYAQALERPELHGMGTTCVALALIGDRAFMAYVGDSRLYLLRQSHLYCMTEDHSVVFELVSQGLLTRQQAREHPDRNVLSRALGSKPQVQISSWDEPFLIRAGDRFLLCSDGLHDVLSDDGLTARLGQGDANEASALLVAAANERGGPDNISAVVVDIAKRAALSRPPSLTREVELT